MNQKNKKAFWAEHIANWKNSGLSQKAYAEQHDLKPHLISYHHRQQQKRPTHKGQSTSKCQEQPFIIPLIANEPSQPITLISPQGFQINIEDNFNAHLLKQVVELLGSTS